MHLVFAEKINVQKTIRGKPTTRRSHISLTIIRVAFLVATATTWRATVNIAVVQYKKAQHTLTLGLLGGIGTWTWTLDVDERISFRSYSPLFLKKQRKKKISPNKGKMKSETVWCAKWKMKDNLTIGVAYRDMIIVYMIWYDMIRLSFMIFMLNQNFQFQVLAKYVEQRCSLLVRQAGVFESPLILPRSLHRQKKISVKWT